MSPASATGAGESVETAAARILDLVHWHQVSQPLDHGTSCCASARRWLSAMHAAGGPTTALSGLGWISDMYPWGPSQWPMSWCKLVEQEKLDCGAHSAVAKEVVRGRGQQLLGVQLLIRAAPRDIAHWGAAWQAEGVAPTWLFDRLYYHEAVGVAAEELVVLDTTKNSKVPPHGGTGHGTVAAIRVTGGATEPLRWGRHDLALGQWRCLDS